MTAALIAVLTVLHGVLVWRLERHRHDMNVNHARLRTKLIKLSDPIKGK